MGQDRPDSIYDRIRETGSEAVEKGKQYSGLVLGTGLETAGKLSGVNVFDYIDPWGGDHLLIHPWFSKDLAKAADRGGHRLGAYLEDSENDRVSTAGEALQDPYTRQALGIGAVSLFTAAKELWYDQDPQALDVAGNYAGMSYHLLQEHHDIDPLRPAKDLYADVKEELGERY